MAIRITDVSLPPSNNTSDRRDDVLSGLRIHSTHGYADLMSHAQVIAALGHTGITRRTEGTTFLPATDRNTLYLRYFLVGRIARVDKDVGPEGTTCCQVTPGLVTLFKQKHLLTLKWKKGARNV